MTQRTVDNGTGTCGQSSRENIPSSVNTGRESSGTRSIALGSWTERNQTQSVPAVALANQSLAAVSYTHLTLPTKA